MIALVIGYQSIERLLNPVPISFDEATVIAVIGLGVNVVSAWLLRDRDDNEHGHRDHHDHNLRAAYLHVLADALISVLAIAALLTGRFYGWVWMDPLMGIVGAAVIAHWSFGLLRSASAVLLDTVSDPRLATEIRQRLEVGADRVADLHLWRLGPGHAAVIAAIVTDRPEPPHHYKLRLEGMHGLSHVTIEVHPCSTAHHGQIQSIG